MKQEILNQGKATIYSLEKCFYSLPERPYFNNLIITGAGDKYLIGLSAKFLWDAFSEVPCQVFHSRVFAEQKPRMVSNKTLVIALSQSGTTRDTLEALRFAKSKHA